MQKKAYNTTAAIRDKIFRGFAYLLTKLHIHANHVTFASVICMILFIMYIQTNIYASVIFLLLSVFCDSLDGVIARYQKCGSDKGKFIDVVTDNFNTFLFALGIAYAGIVDLLYIIAYVYFMLLSKSFRVFSNSFYYKSDWRFKAVAGFLPNLINYLGYLSFILVAFFLPQFFLDYFFSLTSIILFLDSINYFFKIIRL